MTNMRYFQEREGEYIGSTKSDGLEYDIYKVGRSLLLVNEDREYIESIDDIANDKDRFVYTPFLSAYNYYMYDK